MLRDVRYKEADRILTLLSPELGKFTAKARGALRKTSRTGAATQQLCYGEMTLFQNKGKWTVNEATVIEQFDGLREDIEAYALSCYFAECLDSFLPEDQPEPAMLQLCLNSLYALSRHLYDRALIKAAFELRLMCLCGYTPDLGVCPVCGRREIERPVFSLSDGHVFCRECGQSGGLLPLDRPALEAMRYVCAAPAKQLFSFTLDRASLESLAHGCERYLLTQAERGFGTLDYYKQFR